MRGILFGLSAGALLCGIAATLPAPVRYATPQLVPGTRIVIISGPRTGEAAPSVSVNRAMRGDRLDRRQPVQVFGPLCSPLSDRKCRII